MRARWTTRAFIRGELGLCIVCRLLMLATAEYPFACKGCCAKARSLEDLVDIYAAGRRFGMKLLEQKEAKGAKGAKGDSFVPITFGELYGPVACSLCAADAWAIWVTPEEKETHSFEHLFRRYGTARCEKCGPPNQN